jgi:ADP-L-glycero-D-manno-heptose 6-epimerase
MKVLVTGAFGFIGSNVVGVLERRGIKTVLLENFYSGNLKNLKYAKGELIIGDITEKQIFKKLPKLDAVIHEAAITDTTSKDDKQMLRVNFEGFRNVLQYCLSKKIKLVYASSAGVYGNGKMPASETQAPKPLNTYAYSKYLCDRTVLKLLKRNSRPSVIGLRYFNVYGFSEAHKHKAASMIYQLYLQIRSRQRPRIFKYGEQKRDFIYVKDAAKITVKALLELNGSTILNVGTGRARSFNEIIRILNRRLRTNLRPAYFKNPYSGLYQDYTVADTSNLFKKLKIKAGYSLEKGIEDYIKRIRQYEGS